MRGVYTAAVPAGEDVPSLLWSLAERDGFYVNREGFDSELRFQPWEDGSVRIEVYGELGENLLVWAKRQGLLRVRRAEPDGL